jgi:hypothetical protein
VHLIAPVAIGGAVPRPELPDAFAKYQPGLDYEIGTNLKLVRFEGFTDDPFHATEQLGHHADSAYSLDYWPVRPTSIGFTGTY